MSYILHTTINARGNKVFLKQKVDGAWCYIVQQQNGPDFNVYKDWIMEHSNEILNLGISGDKIYPVEPKQVTSGLGHSTEKNTEILICGIFNDLMKMPNTSNCRFTFKEEGGGYDLLTP